MAGPVQTLPFGVQVPGIGVPISWVPGVAKISPNARVKATTGLLGTVADTVVFPGPPVTSFVVGRWLVPNQRCRVGGLPTISTSAAGRAFTSSATPGPMRVIQGDPRVRAM